MAEVSASTAVGETCAGCVFGAGFVLLAMVLVVTFTRSTPRPPRRQRHRSVRRRACAASFAAAVAAGDLDRAERTARCVLDQTSLLVTDLHVVVAGSITQLGAALHRPDTRQRWFPEIRAVDGGDRTATLLPHQVVLNDLSTRWSTDDCLSFHAESGGCDIAGHLTLRTALCRHAPASALTKGVEISVHTEISGNRRRRRIKRTLHRALAHGLDNIHAEHRHVPN
jgi:hypothetical protein